MIGVVFIEGEKFMAEKFPVARAFLGRAEVLHGQLERSIWRFETTAKLQREMNTKIRAAGMTPDERDSLSTLVQEMNTRNDAICDELKAVTKEIEDTIRAATDDNTAAVLDERYLCFHSIEEIMKHCHWSRRWAIHLHMQGLEDVERYLAGQKESYTEKSEES